ncbi:hypothetical protein LAZ67_14002390 [Cordylochernes scorpioides]|uniref:HTH CENPB-type domain-containing protein n=1 Tax=Cordylochernes scorpioides TaxID=51811 RepID=A0ABY6L6Y0_9ARAC|nr:hypothetical protein LAZ67_14002390 [Cordylochernes scorpioides]
MKIIEEIEQGKSHSQVSRERNIPRSTISTIFKNKFAIKSALLKSNFSSTLKHDRDGEFPEIEEALFRWIRQANAMKLAINGNILKEKAILLALKMGQDNFEASNGWLEKFKARRNIAFKRLHGEAGSVDANSVATWKGGIIPSLLAKYSPQDIFNADETGLFYKLLPNQTMTIRGFVMDEAMEEVVEEEMNRCFEALKKHQAIDVNYIDFLEVDKDVQVAGEQPIEEIVKEVMGKEEDEEDALEAGDLSKSLYSYAQVRSASVSMELPLVNVSTCELRSVIRFFTAKNETAVNIHRNLVSVYGEGCMSIQMVRRWRSWFLEGRQNVHDDERSDRPVTATDNAAVAAVRNVVEANRRVTIDEIMIRLPPGIEIGCSSIGTIMRRRTTGYEDRTRLGTTVVSKNRYNGTKNVWTEME